MHREAPYQRPASTPHASGLPAPAASTHGALTVHAARRRGEASGIQGACTTPAPRLQNAVAAFPYLPPGVAFCMHCGCNRHPRRCYNDPL